MKNLLFLFGLFFFANFYAFSQDHPGFDLVLAKRAIAEKKAKEHYADYLYKKDWGRDKIEYTQWHKGSYEIWFYTGKRIIGKMHYNSEGKFKFFEKRDWSILGY